MSLERGATYQETSSLLQFPCCFRDSGGCAKVTPDILHIPGDARQPDNRGRTAKSPTAPYSTHSSPHWKEPTATCGRASPEQPLLHAARMLQGCRGDAAGNAMGMGRADLRTTALPGCNWAQRKKLLFISPFWKWPNSSNNLLKFFYIETAISISRTSASSIAVYLCTSQEHAVDGLANMCSTEDAAMLSSKKNKKTQNVYFQVNANCTSPEGTNTFLFLRVK